MTPRQLRLLQFIEGFQRSRGYGPSCQEMAAGIGLRSKSNAARLLDGLEERGAIRRTHSRVRRVELLQSAAPASRAPDGVPLYFVPILRQPEDGRERAA